MSRFRRDLDLLGVLLHPYSRLMVETGSHPLRRVDRRGSYGRARAPRGAVRQCLDPRPS